jgi:four helix bundle protein
MPIGLIPFYGRNHKNIVILLYCYIVMKTYLQLNDIKAYKRAFILANFVWDIVISWDAFARNTVGGQFVRAIDSISANIAEGFGRYTKKDKISFYRISFSSVKESLDWNEKALRRKLITKTQYDHILIELQELPKEIHHLIRFTNDRLEK